jgi:hypothetical protein
MDQSFGRAIPGVFTFFAKQRYFFMMIVSNVVMGNAENLISPIFRHLKNHN